MPGSSLHAAVAAVAHANFAARYNVPELKVSAIRHYGEAIRGVRTAMQTPEQAQLDQTLGVTLLLELFEVHTIPPPDLP